MTVSSTNAIAALFHPHRSMAAHLLATLADSGSDGSHDLSHILRVWANAQAIAATEPQADVELLVAAVILHDCVAVEKNDPNRASASRLASERARDLMAPYGFEPARLDALAHAIEAHSFSAGIEPITLEARILQDADRLDAIGAIGIARCFYIAGRMGSRLYDPEDPLAADRPLDDKRFALDHFTVKLFKIADGFRTEAGRSMALHRKSVMQAFVDDMTDDIGASVGSQGRE